MIFLYTYHLIEIIYKYDFFETYHLIEIIYKYDFLIYTLFNRNNLGLVDVIQ